MVTERGNHHSNKLFLKKVGLLNKNQEILEIGSGLGVMLGYLSKGGYSVRGVEVNDEYITKAKKEHGLNIEKVENEKLNFPDNSFDIVLSFDVFEHIPNSDEHLREVGRVLKGGGYYLFQTPNKLINTPFEIIKERSFVKYKRYHCSLHNYWELKERLRRHGFDVEFVEVPVVNEHFIAKVKKYLGVLGLVFIKVFNPDKMPIPLKSNFYVIAQLKERKHLL